MANAKKCDRCGKYYIPDATKRYVLAIYREKERHNPSLKPIKSPLDLCDECHVEIHDFFYSKEVVDDNGQSSDL